MSEVRTEKIEDLSRLTLHPAVEDRGFEADVSLFADVHPLATVPSASKVPFGFISASPLSCPVCHEAGDDS